MKRLLALSTLLVIILSGIALAETKSLIVFAVEQAKSVEVGLIRRPEVVSIPVRINSKHKDPSVRFQEISKARQILIQATEKDNRFKVHKGPVYLSPISKSLMKSSYYSSDTSQATINILMSLNTVNNDVFRAASEIAKFVQSIKAPGKSSYGMKTMKLGVENPHNYRSELLDLIDKDITKIKDGTESKAKFTLEGLESPVLVRQVDDNQVELFIDYKLSIEVE